MSFDQSQYVCLQAKAVDRRKIWKDFMVSQLHIKIKDVQLDLQKYPDHGLVTARGFYYFFLCMSLCSASKLESIDRTRGRRALSAEDALFDIARVY